MFHGPRKPLRYTFWLSKENYGHNTDKLKLLPTTSKEELAAIRLDKPGLYPTLEED